MEKVSTRGTRTPTLGCAQDYLTSQNLFIVVVLSLAISPVSLFGSDVRIFGFGLTTIHNVLVVLSVIPYVLQYGLKENKGNPVVVAFGILAVTSFTLATQHPSLSSMQILKSLSAYMLGPLLFEIKITDTFRRLLRWTLPTLALVSITVGLLLTVLGIRAYYRIDYTGVFRIQGATIPAHLAMLALVGMMAGTYYAYHDKRQLALFFINFGIIMWSGTRGSIAAAVIVATTYVVADSIHKRNTANVKSRKLISIALLVLIFVSYLPNLITRSTYSNYYDTVLVENISKEATNDAENTEDADGFMFNSSGRLTAWLFFTEVAFENLSFGRGIGTGTVAAQGKLHPAFSRAPHNEYIRLLVDGGLVGVVLITLAYALVFWKIQKNLKAHLKITVFSSFIVFALLATVDNVISTQQFAVPFWLYLAMLHSETNNLTAFSNK